MTRAALLRGALRLVPLVALIYGAMELARWVSAALGLEVLPHNEALAYRLILLSLIVYALLLAVPFLPGAEIGITLLAMFGPSLAVAVYGATVLGLSLAFVVGRLVPPATTCQILTRLNLPRAARLVARAETGDPATMTEMLDLPWARGLLRYRYLALAVLINTPGNVVIGGGGGLAMMAGMSRAYAPSGFLLTVALAVAPLPLAILVFGPALLA